MHKDPRNSFVKTVCFSCLVFEVKHFYLHPLLGGGVNEGSGKKFPLNKNLCIG